MDELRAIKAELSHRYNSQTPEERRRDSAEAIRVAEAYLGRPMEAVDQPTHRREEVSQV
jgi:hypothetical protein